MSLLLIIKAPNQNISRGNVAVVLGKSKSEESLFKVGQCKQNVTSHLKWVLVADKSVVIFIFDRLIDNNTAQTPVKFQSE